MRILLAIVVLGGVIASDATAQAARKHSIKPQEQGYAQPRSYTRERALRAQVECEGARHEDPTGAYAGYACWAGEAFARGLSGNHN
jgi:hypothetical protein